MSASRKSGDKRGHRKSDSLHDSDFVERRGKRDPAASHRQASKTLIFRLFPSDPHARAAGTPTGGSLFLRAIDSWRGQSEMTTVNARGCPCKPLRATFLGWVVRSVFPDPGETAIVPQALALEGN